VVEIETLSPLFALRIRTPWIELRLPTRDELVTFARVAQAGIHPPETRPFWVAWTDAAGEAVVSPRRAAARARPRADPRPLGRVSPCRDHDRGTRAVLVALRCRL